MNSSLKGLQEVHFCSCFGKINRFPNVIQLFSKSALPWSGSQGCWSPPSYYWTKAGYTLSVFFPNVTLNYVFFSISRLLPSSGGKCTPRPQAVRPTVCLLLGSIWVETPPCWSVTCCWPTLGSTTVKSRPVGSTTGARSTSLCLVSICRGM